MIPMVLACLSVQVGAQEYNDSLATTGYAKTQSAAERTSSVSIIKNEDFNKRSAKNIGNSLFGQGAGLMTLQGNGQYSNAEPTFYIRGLKTMSKNNPLILVDGIERDIDKITSEEVENVIVLKDAAAVAIYGYKGINGVINIETKRGKYRTKEVNVSYEHGFEWQARKPQFVNSATYATAVNEALANDGMLPRYSQDELNAFNSGTLPYLYPNVNWVDETMGELASTNIYNVSFRGGADKFRYYALGSLINNKGFIGSPNENEGYSTQDQYSKANLRMNLDIDLTNNTKLKLNILGSLMETRSPGAIDTNIDDTSGDLNLWSSMLYVLPSAAFPIKLEDGTWGGNSTWKGTLNPIAMSQGAAYSKQHERSVFADMTLIQNLSSITPGLGASVMISYDNTALFREDHSKTFVYGSDIVTSWENGVPAATTHFSEGKDSDMGSAAKVTTYKKAFNVSGTLYYDKALNEDHHLYSQLKWDYESRKFIGLNTTYYRYNTSLYTHYGYKDKMFADLSISASASNRMAPGSKWAFSPTLSLAWVLSKEDFMKDNEWINFLKLRASAGVINSDQLPLDSNGNEVYNYFEQTYGGGSTYPLAPNDGLLGSYVLGRLASPSLRHEKAYKYNIGVDASLFNSLDITLDGYYERRSDIWVDSKGKYSSILGFDTPFENAGIVDSWGVDFGANYTKKIGEVKLNAGANFLFAKNKIVEQLEEARLYSNLVTTNDPLKQTYGLQAIGFFKDQADIDNSPKQLFSDVKAGDIKYKDVNKDNVIDSNDKTAIGYSTTAPEIYYSFHLGADWKGLGFDAMFQGTGRYSAVLNTKSLFWPLINNTTISQEYFDNRWTPENQDAKYPRLSSQSNDNNYQTNTLWLADRSFLKLRSVEVYYKLPQCLLQKTKVVRNAKLYVRGIDLLCFDNVKVADPECYGAGYPLTRSVVAGVSIGF